MADVAHERIPTKYKLGDVTAKGVVTCVMASRHAHQSRYIVDGKTLYEWQIDDLGQQYLDKVRAPRVLSDEDQTNIANLLAKPKLDSQ